METRNKNEYKKNRTKETCKKENIIIRRHIAKKWDKTIPTTLDRQKFQQHMNHLQENEELPYFATLLLTKIYERIYVLPDTDVVKVMNRVQT